MAQFDLILSNEEMELLFTIRELGFGELYGVEVPDGPKWNKVRVNQQESDLIDTIRSGLSYIDVLHVHQGAPVLMETDYKLNGFRCRKKVRFGISNKGAV